MPRKPPSAPPAAAQAQARAIVRCESNGNYTRCPAAESWRGARLVQQLSQTPCLQGRNWGFDRNAIWVNDGCRGVFAAGDPSANVGQRVTCASTSGGRTQCPADTRYGVKLVRQLSTASCAEGRTWGTDNAGIWVDRGCRGEFEIGGGAGGGGQTTDKVTCGSITGSQVTCRTNGYATDVRVARDLSYGRCREGQNWGHTDSFIWANQGCRAEFEVTYRGGGGEGGVGGGGGATESERVTCGAGTGRRITCSPEGSISSARMVRDRSGGRCRSELHLGLRCHGAVDQGRMHRRLRAVGAPVGGNGRAHSVGQLREHERTTDAVPDRRVRDQRAAGTGPEWRLQRAAELGVHRHVHLDQPGVPGRFEVTYHAQVTPHN